MSKNGQPLSVSGDITPIAEGIKTNLNATPSGVNKIFTAFLGKKYAENARYQALAVAQTQKDIERIAIGEAVFVNGEVTEIPSLAEQSKELSWREIQQREEEQNFSGCMLEAITDSSSRQNDADEQDIPSKFFSRWRAEAVHMSSAEERQLWGRILSEEAHRAGSFSLRTLDILRNLDRQGALIFEKACDYVVNRHTVLLGVLTGDNQDKVYPSSISANEAATLENLGLCTMPGHASYMKSVGERVFLSVGEYNISIETGSDILYLHCTLTESGRELYRIVSSLNIDKVLFLCRFFRKSKVIPRENKIFYFEHNNVSTTVSTAIGVEYIDTSDS